MHLIEGLHDYDFEFTVRADARFGASRPAREVEAVLAALPGVVPGEAGAFGWSDVDGRRVVMRVEFRVPDDGTGTRVPSDDLANCVHLVIPARARSAALERGYFAFALDLAERLGWELHDDTDSGVVVSRRRLEAFDPPPTRPWRKLW